MGSGRTYQTNNCFEDNIGCYTNLFFEYNPLTDSWMQKASIPKSFAYGNAISVNGKGYAGLGDGSHSTPGVGWPPNLDWYEYSPSTNSWLSLSKIDEHGGMYSEIAMSAIGNEIYIYGGRAASGFPYHGLMRKYSIQSNLWNFFSLLGDNRYDTAGFYKDGKIYIAGGFDAIGIKSDMYEYDINTNQWSLINQMQGLYNSQNIAVIGNKLYIVGGRSDYMSPPYTGYFEGLLEYNLDSKTWTRKADNIGGERGYVITHVYNNQLYAFGGYKAGSELNTISRYNADNDTWSYLESAPVNISSYNGVSCLLGDYFYYFYNKSNPSVYRYSFINNAWETLATNIDSNTNHNSFNVFTYKNKIYMHYKTSYYPDSSPVIKQFNLTTNQVENTDVFVNIPFASQNQLIVSATDGVYFGFGTRYEYPSVHNSNSWTKLRFNAEVSTDTGIYQTGYYDDELDDENYNPTCNMGTTGNGSLYDFKGGLFAGTENVNMCLKVESRPQTQAYYTQTENNKRRTYLNKSFIIGAKNNMGKLRLYYTTAELQTFVDNYNTLYGTNQTINDIKIINVSTYPSPSDFDPTNNSSFPTRKYPIYGLKDYGIDKFFEISEELMEGEIHLYLEKDVLTVNDIKKESISIYPNPVKNTININSQDKVSAYEIYSLDGKKLQTGQKENFTQIDVSKLVNGNYILKLQTKSGEQTFTIIKSN